MSTSFSSSSPTSISSTFNAIPTGKHNTSSSTTHHNVYIIALSILGGIILLSLFGLIVYWYINQRRRQNRHQRIKESFWQKWHWKVYSRVDDAQSFSSSLSAKESLGIVQYGQRQRGYEHHDNDDEGDLEAEKEKSGSGIMDWWYGRRRNGLKMVEEGFEDGFLKEKKKKQKLGTVHKVKRFKPNESFEIDSDVRLSIDLTLVPSRSR